VPELLPADELLALELLCATLPIWTVAGVFVFPNTVTPWAFDSLVEVLLPAVEMLVLPAV
jgi:hypothetical protein